MLTVLLTESLLSDRLDTLSTLFPSHLVVLAGSPLPRSLSARSTPSDEALAHPPAPFYDTMQVIQPSDQPAGASFLSRYQILTPGLVSALLVVFVVFLPILMLGVGAVASIQSPVRMEAPKAVSQERKNQ
jgi:hypothetical protein